MLYDAYGRPLTNLRISVTRECNYRCVFCHIEGHPSGRPSRPGSTPPLMSPYEYAVTAKAAYKLGIREFKLTGGEPLLRKDIEEIVKAIRSEAPGSDISMTTNGYLLKDLALKLRDAGLNRINVSLHSLKREVYARITGVDGLDRVLEGIRSAIDAGYDKIKINAVVLRGLNENELWSLLEYARSIGAVLQLIELHPVGLGAKSFRRFYTPLERFERALIEAGAKVTRRELHNRPIYILPDGSIVEVVRPYANPIFCLGCRRVRLHDDGTLSPCLNWRGPRVDLVSRIRSVTTFEEKVAKAVEALREVNMLRRPFYLWPRNDAALMDHARELGLTGNSRPLRLSIPKKSKS
ncbi:MAG: GTP 3',8-cyclase MoaA [Desulfurococcales archaeon]|nr:GTP 3',8-cyclase MoaA [Desulfurococcales archaeon]